MDLPGIGFRLRRDNCGWRGLGKAPIERSRDQTRVPGVRRRTPAQAPALPRPDEEGKIALRGELASRMRRLRLGAAFPLPSEEALSSYYLADYWKTAHGAAGLTDVDRFPRDNLALFNRGASIAALVAEYVDPAVRNILDVGAGYGHVMHALGERFPRARRLAAESSEACQRHLVSIGVEVVRAPIQELLSRSRSRAMSSCFRMSWSTCWLHVSFSAIYDRRSLRMESSASKCRTSPRGPKDGSSIIPGSRASTSPTSSFFSPPVITRFLERLGFEVTFAETVGPGTRIVSSRGFALRTDQIDGLRRFLPRRLVARLRRQRVGIAARDEAFYRYGGPRIWLRCVARRGSSAGHSAS